MGWGWLDHDPEPLPHGSVSEALSARQLRAHTQELVERVLVLRTVTGGPALVRPEFRSLDVIDSPHGPLLPCFQGLSLEVVSEAVGWRPRSCSPGQLREQGSSHPGIWKGGQKDTLPFTLVWGRA